NIAANVVTERDVFDGVSKPNALHVTGKVAGFAVHRLGRGHGADDSEDLRWGEEKNSPREPELAFEATMNRLVCLPLLVEVFECDHANVRLVGFVQILQRHTEVVLEDGLYHLWAPGSQRKDHPAASGIEGDTLRCLKQHFLKRGAILSAFGIP